MLELLSSTSWKRDPNVGIGVFKPTCLEFETVLQKCRLVYNDLPNVLFVAFRPSVLAKPYKKRCSH